MKRIIGALAITLGVSCTDKTDIDKSVGLEDQEIVLQSAPARELDLIVLLDTSFTHPYRQKFRAQFPKLIDALKDPTRTPSLPDLRIAIITADVGTGASKRCTPQYGDQGKFQMPNAKVCGVDPGATFLESKAGKNVNFDANQDIAQVFGCLAVMLDDAGCGFEQPLQSLYYSMFLADPVTNTTQAQQFIRPHAQLGIIILTDEDDCSMPLDSLISEESAITRTESWSIRCATRGHQCGDTKMVYPTTAPYENDFYACKAREDTCPPGENGRFPTSCSPLENVKGLADKLKQVKTAVIDGQATVDIKKFLVAGIFGWPTKNQTSATYKIDKIPGSAVDQSDHLFDYWPVCYDPDYPLPANLGDVNQVHYAFGWGATGGLRIKAFLDEFPKDSALAYSICERDYTIAMGEIGRALARKLSDVCVPLRLHDTDPNRSGLQPSCQVSDVIPVAETDGSVEMRKGPNIPHCDGAKGNKPCWKLASDPKKCPETLTAAGGVIPSQMLVMERAEAMPVDTRTILRCQTLP